MNKKYIMSEGTFKCKETNETTNTISGKLVGLRVIVPEGGSETIQLDLQDDSGEEPVVNTLSILHYGDASTKILRCLYGIAEIIRDKVLTFTLEDREGRKKLIKISADGEVLTPCGTVEPYAYDKKLVTDKCLVVLKNAFSFKFPVLVFANEDRFSGNAQEVADYIRDLKSSGRGGELTVVKTVFTSINSANGYMKAIKDLAATRGFQCFRNEEDIDLIWEAFNEVAPEDEGSEHETVESDENEDS